MVATSFRGRRLWNNKLFNAPVNLSLLRQQHLKLSGSLFIVMNVENRIFFVEEKQRKEKRRLLRSTIAYCRCTIRECPSAAKCLCLSFRSCSKQWWPRGATNTTWEINTSYICHASYSPPSHPPFPSVHLHKAVERHIPHRRGPTTHSYVFRLSTVQLSDILRRANILKVGFSCSSVGSHPLFPPTAQLSKGPPPLF